MSEIIDLIKKEKLYLTADLNKVGCISIYRSSTADSEGRYLAYVLDGQGAKHYLYGNDVCKYIYECYAFGTLKINYATVLGIQAISERASGSSDWIFKGYIFTTYDVARKEFLATNIPVDEPTIT